MIGIANSNMSDYKELQLEAKEIRKQVLSMILSAHASHIGSAYSVVDILVYLYNRVLQIDPAKPFDPSRDIFILSKGWAVSSLYAVLERKKFFNKKMLEEYCQNGTKMIGAATRNGIPGIEATTASMGHGVPIGVGMAKAHALRNQKSKVVVVMSDGESDEGSTWEAALIGAHHKLSNLYVIVDHNKWQSFGRVKDVLNLDSLANKWKSFNWDVHEVDGHNFKDLEKAFSACEKEKNKPHAIIAHTIKGKGLSAIEDKNEWHYQTPRAHEIEVAKKEGLL